MSRLTDLINPPNVNMDVDERYKLETSLYDTLDSLSNVSNESEVTNADFSTLSAQGQTPTTEADGDDFEFIDNWFVVGATQATYSIVAQDYPDNSEVQSRSDFFLDIDVSFRAIFLSKTHRRG